MYTDSVRPAERAAAPQSTDQISTIPFYQFSSADNSNDAYFPQSLPKNSGSGADCPAATPLPAMGSAETKGARGAGSQILSNRGAEKSSAERGSPPRWKFFHLRGAVLGLF